KVRVRRSGMDVRARKGYWAPSLTEIERARTDVAAAEAVPAEVSSALTALSSPRPDRTIDVWIGAAAGADRRPQMTVAWTPRPQRDRSVDLGRAVSIAVRGADGERVFEQPLEAGRFSFPA